MAAIQYLIPGAGYVNEGTAQIEYLVPGGGYQNETSVTTAATTVFRRTLSPVGTRTGSRQVHRGT